MADLLAPFAGDRAPALAERLLGKFGGLGRAIAADPAVIGDSDLSEACRIVQAARRLTEGALQEELVGTPVVPDDARLFEYLRALLGSAPEERFHAVFLDHSGRYLRDERITSGSSRSVRFRASGLFRRALDLGAAQILLAHNHPSGSCQPSEQDIEVTDHLVSIAAALDLELVDHLIVTRTRVFSFRAGGLL